MRRIQRISEACSPKALLPPWMLWIVVLTMGLGALNVCLAASGPGVTATIYVGRHFEVRDQDQPVKYVLNDQTRVARITGSLSSNSRLQRLRLHTGWNLVSLAVTAEDFLGQVHGFAAGEVADPLLRGAYRWESVIGEYRSVAPGENVLGGSILWLHARTNRVIGLQGEYVGPVATTLPAGGAFVPGAGLETSRIQLPAGASLWKFDASARTWRAGYGGDLAPLGNLPELIAPGEAIYVHSAESIEITGPDRDQQIAYIHPDHLDSSSAVTDGAGKLIEETAFHPFGAPRHQHRPAGLDSAYAFTQKERDRESRLHYFEARYLAGGLARFLTFDPLVQKLEALDDSDRKSLLSQPAKLNPFVYALNNPVRYNDPDGRDARPRSAGPKPKAPVAELTIRIGPAAKGSKELSALSLNLVQPVTAPRATSGAGGTTKPTPPDIQITRHSDAFTHELLSKSRDGSVIKSLTIILPGKDGDFRIHLTDVFIQSVSFSKDQLGEKPTETFTLNAGTIQFGDPEPAASTRESTQSWHLQPKNSQ